METCVTTLESFTGGQPSTVDFTAIERELAGLWKAASTAPKGGAGPAVTRACHLNLLVQCSSAEEATRATATIAQVTRACPSRVVMAVSSSAVSPAQENGNLEAFISAHCAYTPGAAKGRQVCCEQITITADAAASPRLPGAVLPLLLPDLPVVLWWPGDLRSIGADTRHLIDASDRVVVDSRRFSDAAAGYARLASLECPVSDLAWHRLRPWRELAAGQFDGRIFESYPARIETVEVEHAGGPAGQAEGLLLGCWVASRLRWRLASAVPRPDAMNRMQQAAAPGAFDFVRPGGEPARLLVRGLPDKEPAGRILSLILKAADASFTLRRDADTESVTIHIAVSEACPMSRVARVVVRDDATLLCRSLQSGGRDAIYVEALKLAARLLAPDDAVRKEKDP
jgi:glucose-6-phosphate dehydrogenase assembly protein OpcA